MIAAELQVAAAMLSANETQNCNGRPFVDDNVKYVCEQVMRDEKQETSQFVARFNKTPRDNNLYSSSKLKT